jgi:hypothetical protein
MNHEPAEDHLDKIERYLTQRPFVPFRVRCGTAEFEIRKPDQGRFNRFGSFEFREEVVKITVCNNDHINFVEPL